MVARKRYVQPNLWGFISPDRTKKQTLRVGRGKKAEVFPISGARRYRNPLGINAIANRAKRMRYRKRKAS